MKEIKGENKSRSAAKEGNEVGAATPKEGERVDARMLKEEEANGGGGAEISGRRQGDNKVILF